MSELIIDALKLALLVAILANLASLSTRVDDLEHNYESIKRWMKVLRGFDIDKVTDAVRQHNKQRGKGRRM